MQKANIKAILHIGVERFVNYAFFTRLKNIKQIVHKHFYMTLNLFLLHIFHSHFTIISCEIAFTCCDACSFGNNLSLIGVWCTRILFSFYIKELCCNRAFPSIRITSKLSFLSWLCYCVGWSSVGSSCLLPLRFLRWMEMAARLGVAFLLSLALPALRFPLPSSSVGSSLSLMSGNE